MVSGPGPDPHHTHTGSPTAPGMGCDSVADKRMTHQTRPHQAMSDVTEQVKRQTYQRCRETRSGTATLSIPAPASSRRPCAHSASYPQRTVLTVCTRAREIQRHRFRHCHNSPPTNTPPTLPPTLRGDLRPAWSWARHACLHTLIEREHRHHHPTHPNSNSCSPSVTER
jgi:hypothetical protein